MPQLNKGARLWSESRDGRDAIWQIRHGKWKYSTGTRDLAKAEAALARYLGSPKHFRMTKVNRRKRLKPNDVLWMYAVEVAAEGRPVKIGLAQNVKARMWNLRVSCPFPMNLLACVPINREIERAVHRHLEPFRIRGEWFTRTPEVDAVIDAIANDRVELLVIPRLAA